MWRESETEFTSCLWQTPPTDIYPGTDLASSSCSNTERENTCTLMCINFLTVWKSPFMLFKCFFNVQKILSDIEKSKCDALGDSSVMYLHDWAINIIIVVLFSNTVCLASTLPFRPPPVWQGQPYFPHTSASLPPSLHHLCFLPLCGNFWSVIPRSLRPLPVVFPRGLRRYQSWTRLQSAKYFAIDLTDARRCCSFFAADPHFRGQEPLWWVTFYTCSSLSASPLQEPKILNKKKSRTFVNDHNMNGSF